MSDASLPSSEVFRARAARCEALAGQTPNLASRQVFQGLAMRWRKLAAEREREQCVQVTPVP